MFADILFTKVRIKIPRDSVGAETFQRSTSVLGGGEGRKKLILEHNNNIGSVDDVISEEDLSLRYKLYKIQ